MQKTDSLIPIITAPDGLTVAPDRGRYDIIRKEFLSSLEMRDESLKAYRNAITQFFSWILSTGRDLSSMSQTDIRIFKKNLLESGHSPLTVNMYLIVVRKFYEWAEATLSYPNIARGVKNASGETGFVKMHLSPSQATALLEHFRESGSLRNYAMVNIMLRAGLRTVEVSRSQYGHLKEVTCEEGRRLVLYVHGKKHEDTGTLSSRNFVVLGDKAAGPLLEYLASRGPLTQDSPMFATDGKGHRGKALSTRTIQAIVKEGLRSIGIDSHQYSSHSLRHTTAVSILEGNGTFNDVQRVLRHKSVDTSKIYTESVERDLHIRKPSEFIIDNVF